MTYTAANKKAFSDALTWMSNPDPQSVAVYNAYTLPVEEAGRRQPGHPAGHL